MNQDTPSQMLRASSRLATRELPRGADALSVQIQGLQHWYGKGELRKQALFDNHLELSRGEIVIMTGPSGSGKTTLLTLIGALRGVQQGRLSVLGRELSQLSPRELVGVRRDIGFIFQAHNLFASLTALQNVRMALELHDVAPQRRDEQAAEMLRALGLEQRLHYKPQSLSGGQRQRVAIARALVNKPQIVLADEPTAALDKQSGRDVVELLKTIARIQRATILIVTHDNRILDVADRIVNMVDGRIISDVVVSSAAVVCDFLRQCRLFKNLTPATLSSVADSVEIESVDAGQEVVRQGESGDKFYIIRQGRAEVLVRDDTGPRRVATLVERDFFGEAALLTGEPRNATVRALDNLDLYVLGKVEFQRAIDSCASFHDELRHAVFERQ